MARIAFEIPDDQVQRVLSSIGWDGTGSPRTFFVTWLREQLRKAVFTMELQDEIKQTHIDFQTNYQAPDINEESP